MTPLTGETMGVISLSLSEDMSPRSSSRSRILSVTPAGFLEAFRTEWSVIRKMGVAFRLESVIFITGPLFWSCMTKRWPTIPFQNLWLNEQSPCAKVPARVFWSKSRLYKEMVLCCHWFALPERKTRQFTIFHWKYFKVLQSISDRLGVCFCNSLENPTIY